MNNRASAQDKELVEPGSSLPLMPIQQSVPATIVSLQDAEISSEVSANINRIQVDVGDTVEKGEVLAQLDCREFLIAQEQAQADVNSLKARIAPIKARAQAARYDMAASESNVAMLNSEAKEMQAGASAAQAEFNRSKTQANADKAQCRLAHIELKRSRQLRNQQLISQQALDQAETTFRVRQAECQAIDADLGSFQAKAQAARVKVETAQGAVRVQQAKVKMAQSSVVAIESELPALHAQIAAANARLKMEQLNVSRCVLRAPFTGQIAQRMVQIGQRIGIGEEAFQIISTIDKEVSASVSDEELELLKAEKSIYFQTPEKRYALKLRASVDLVTGEARTREVRFVLKDDNDLAIGKVGRIVWGKQKIQGTENDKKENNQ